MPPYLFLMQQRKTGENEELPREWSQALQRITDFPFPPREQNEGLNKELFLHEGKEPSLPLQSCNKPVTLVCLSFSKCECQLQLIFPCSTILYWYTIL